MHGKVDQGQDQQRENRVKEQGHDGKPRRIPDLGAHQYPVTVNTHQHKPNQQDMKFYAGLTGVSTDGSFKGFWSHDN